MPSNPVRGRASRGGLVIVLAISVVIALCGMPGGFFHPGFFAAFLLVFAVIFGLAIGVITKLIELGTRAAGSKPWSTRFFVVVGALLGWAILGALWLRRH